LSPALTDVAADAHARIERVVQALTQTTRDTT
jgi:hypothetical protein